MEIETITKKWGSSLGLIIPKKIVREERIQAGQKIRVNILSKKKTTGADIFEMVKKHPLPKRKDKRSTQEVLDEIDKELEPETKVKDIFGALKNWKRPTQEILDETDRDFEPEMFA